MSRRAKFGLIILVAIAFALRVRGLFANTFHADEALFATWARQIAVLRDPFLANQLVDKPPLLFYLQALFYPLAGPVEWAARLPNLIASILLVPVTGMLAWRLYKVDTAAVIAAAVITLSPLMVQFSATAYTDPLLTTLIALSVYLSTGTLVARDRDSDDLAVLGNKWALISGLVFGLSAATKYQALLVVPFLVGLFYLFRWRRGQWLRWLTGVIAIVVLVAIWEMLRTDSPEIWRAQLSSYGGLRAAWSWELWPRLLSWTGQWRFLSGSSFLVVLFLFLTIPYLFVSVRAKDALSSIDLLLGLFILSYLVVHWLIAIPIWDRYLLLIAPYFAILSARIVWRLYGYVKLKMPFVRNQRRYGYYLAGLALILVIPLQSADIFSSYRGELPIGGSPSADGGISAAAIFLRKQPPGSVLYDHWYSWQWRYHLFDSNVYVSWFPDPQSLADDLRIFGTNEDVRFVALPNSGEAQPVWRAIRAAGYDLEPALEASDISADETFELYRIVKQ